MILNFKNHVLVHTYVKKAIAKGIPGTLRGMMWQLMYLLLPTLEYVSSQVILCFKGCIKGSQLESTYLKLLKESSIHEKAILRDLGRLERAIVL